MPLQPHRRQHDALPLALLLLVFALLPRAALFLPSLPALALGSELVFLRALLASGIVVGRTILSILISDLSRGSQVAHRFVEVVAHGAVDKGGAHACFSSSILLILHHRI